jgi:IS30 family transposase
VRISKMLAASCSYTEIATFLGRSISTVGREVYRNCADGEYLAVEAHKKASKRQAYSHAPKAKIIRNVEMKSLVHAELSFRWSPKQISQWLLKTQHLQVSHEQSISADTFKPKVS